VSAMVAVAECDLSTLNLLLVSRSVVAGSPQRGGSYRHDLEGLSAGDSRHVEDGMRRCACAALSCGVLDATSSGNRAPSRIEQEARS